MPVITRTQQCRPHLHPPSPHHDPRKTFRRHRPIRHIRKTIPCTPHSWVYPLPARAADDGGQESYIVDPGRSCLNPVARSVKMLTGGDGNDPSSRHRSFCGILGISRGLVMILVSVESRALPVPRLASSLFSMATMTRYANMLSGILVLTQWSFFFLAPSSK